VTIAALYVLANGVYSGRPGVELWPEDRDARLYAGPHPVVAHPPCERWGRYWFGGPSARVRRQLGDDDGCFAAALAAVRRWGGVLEHPEASHAWPFHGVVRPPKGGGWVSAGLAGGWTCCVEQGHYGHQARKATWLLVCGVLLADLPELRWGSCGIKMRLDQGFHSAEERRRRAPADVHYRRLSDRERKSTPPEFADLLLDIASRVAA
jgi:hypothetical protein